MNINNSVCIAEYLLLDFILDTGIIQGPVQRRILHVPNLIRESTACENGNALIRN